MTKENIDKILPNSKLKDLGNEFLFEISHNYQSYIKTNPEIKLFSDILKNFLLEYFKNSDFLPEKCRLMMFNFYGEDYSEPMIKITYPNEDRYDNLKMKDELEEKFKVYLVKISKDVNEFKEFRKIQKKFRFVIYRV